jgi:hypothetical protein
MKTLARDKTKRLFSFEHVSRETGLAPDTLRKMAQRGQLEVILCNRQDRIPARELERLTGMSIENLK